MKRTINLLAFYFKDRKAWTRSPVDFRRPEGSFLDLAGFVMWSLTENFDHKETTNLWLVGSLWYKLSG